MSIIYLGKATPASGQGGGGSGEAVWGDITGTLSDQTDLQTALNAKQDELTAGTGIDITNDTISVDGEATTLVDTELVSTVTLATVATSGDYADLSNKPLPFSGATGTMDGTSGLVPTPIATDYDKFLKGDGTWGTPSGGSVTVDQVYSASSVNAQSGVAISGAGFLRDSGIPAANTMAIGGTVQGTNNSYGLAVGYLSQLTGQFNGVALGGQAQANSNAIAIGNQTIASGLWSIAIGRGSQSSADYAIALGTECVNSEANSMYVAIGDIDASYNTVSYKLLGTGGKIPNDRINVDVSPTQNSTNFVTSGTIYTVLGDIETLLAAI